MKSTNGILWYFFIIYATSVIVNFVHYQQTLDDANESIILSATKCLMNRRSELNGQNDCKLSFQYKKETVLYFLKNLLSRKEFKSMFKLTLKNGSKKGKSDLVNITLDLKPLFDTENSTNTDNLNYWYSFYLVISILLITFISPLWPLTNYIYLITLTSMFILSFAIYLQLIKLIVFTLVYLLTFKKYKFWLLPNLNNDVGILSTFWPLYEFRRSDATQLNLSKDSSNNRLNNQSNDHSNIQGTNSSDDQFEGSNETILDDQFEGSNETILDDQFEKTNETILDDQLNTRQKLISQNNKTFTQFVGNDQLPTITTTPPSSPQSNDLPTSFDLTKNRRFKKSSLEIVDLNNSEQFDKNLDENKQIYAINSNDEFKTNYSGDYANITPTISYLNVNELRRRQYSPARKRIASNRSDDFEILNHEFINTAQPISNENLFCSKQNL